MTARTIGLVDTTLRDGQQCVWATRMPTAMMLPLAERMDDAGFDRIDVIAAVQFDAMVRFLQENPWERVRLLRERITDTPLNAWVRSKSLVSFENVADDVVELWVDLLVANGIRRVSVFDALHDMSNLQVSVDRCRQHGVECVGAIVYTVSPVHTDDFYVRAVRELVTMGVDRIMIKDPGGLLTLDRVRTLVPALRAATTLPLELHSHCSVGQAPLVYLEAAVLGVDVLHTGIPPLALGQAQPAAPSTLRNLAGRSLGHDVDLGVLQSLADDLAAAADARGLPAGTGVDYDESSYAHQLPGGMLENLKAQLATIGMSDRLPDVLAETARVREDLGYPVMVTPFSQLVATQALMNVTSGRYTRIPDAVRRYVLGHYGRLVAPVADEVVAAVLRDLPPHITKNPPVLEPQLPGLRARYPDLHDEERILRHMLPAAEVDAMVAAGPATGRDEPDPAWRLLADGLKRHPDLTYMHIRKSRPGLGT